MAQKVKFLRECEMATENVQSNTLSPKIEGLSFSWYLKKFFSLGDYILMTK